MDEGGFRAFLDGRGIDEGKIRSSIEAVKALEDHLAMKGVELKEADLGLLTEHIGLLIEEERNSEERLIAIARYCYFVRKNDFYIHIAGLVNAVEVLPGIGMRLGEVAGEAVRIRVFEGVELPPLGSPQEAYPDLTRRVVQRIERELSPEKCRDVLTWNYHCVPTEAFLGHRERFEKAVSIDEYLRNEHRRFIDEITRYMDEGKVWCEQEITPEVIEFVEGNQEVSIGERMGDRIYVTKMPCEPKKYIEERDPIMKRYYACHCPLARTAVRDGGPDIPATFCYCSAGFTKLVYDVIFGESVRIELLESVLSGGIRCRFAIEIPQGKMK